MTQEELSKELTKTMSELIGVTCISSVDDIVPVVVREKEYYYDKDLEKTFCKKSRDFGFKVGSRVFSPKGYEIDLSGEHVSVKERGLTEEEKKSFGLQLESMVSRLRGYDDIKVII